MSNYVDTVVRCVAWGVQTTDTQIPDRHCVDISKSIFLFKSWNELPLFLRPVYYCRRITHKFLVATYMVIVLMSAKYMGQFGPVSCLKLAYNLR